MNWRKPLIYLALYVTGSKIPAYLKEIRRVSAFSDAEKKKYQDAKLEKLLLHAYQHVPYYHRILPEAGVIQNGKVHLEHFENIPVLTKDIIRQEGENLYSDEHTSRKSYKNTSGGSTGEPVLFLQDKEYSDWNIANKISYKTFANQDIGDRELRLWGSERDILEGKEKLSIRLRNWLYNRKEFNSFRMSEQDMHRFAKEWNEFKPRWVEAYVQSIYEFAKFAKVNNIALYSPKGILVTAGTLFPEVEQMLREVFKCKLFNRYGSREVGDMACGEPEKGLQISFWNNFVEVNETNKLDEVFVTNLNNFAMPLVRYQIGDVAIKKNDYSLEKVKGRTVSFIKKADGTLIDGEYFTHLFYLRSWVKQFQVIQRATGEILLKIAILDHEKMEADKDEVENAIKKVMGEDCKIRWETVDNIEPLPSGKYLYVVSEIK